MPFEPGGYADKLGNRHEGRWVVKQLLRLLNEQLRSVIVEAVGDDQQGVDLVVETKDDKRQYQQCKARNACKEHWTFGDLNSRGILAHMKFQLDRSREHEFALVTGVPASMLGDICESARNSSGDPEDYYRFQIQEVGEDRREAYRQFCKHLGLNENDVTDREKAFDYLRRTYIVFWRDDRDSYDDLLSLASLLVSGKPENAIACLAQYAIDNLRKRLTASDVWRHLEQSEFSPRRLAHESRIAPALKELQRRFDDSIVYGLAGGALIPRSETQELRRALDENDLVILHGSAGYGKTGVLYELVTALKEEGATYLPIRLDRQPPRNTPREFGESLGLPESPTLCLGHQVAEKSPVLILDQLDALRWTNSHSANSLEVCKAIVREATSLRANGKPVSIVLSCRTFDLEHDPEIKSWLENQTRGGGRCKKIEVKGLSDDAIKTVVTRLGGHFGEFTQRQKDILASPQHLAMWATIAHDGCISNFRSSTELMRHFWANRYQELVKAGVTEDETDGVLDALVNYMERNGRLSAPSSLIANRQRVAHELQTLGVIRTCDKQVTFCHQSYLDFRIACHLLREIHEGAGRVQDWLGPKEKQSLFRREQLRQVLLLLADESPDEFLVGVGELLESDAVRFHMKHLVLEIVAEVRQPGQPLCEYLLGLWTNQYWRSQISETVFHGQPQYVQFLIDQGLVSNLLDGKDEEDRNTALWLLHSVAEKIPDAVTRLLSPYVSKGGDWAQLVLGGLCWNWEKDSDAMFELKLQLARMGVVNGFVNWKGLAGRDPVRAPRLIEAVVSNWDIPSLKDNSLSRRATRSRLEHWTAEDLQALKTTASTRPAETWNLLMPHVERLTAVESDRYDSLLDGWLHGDRFEIDDAGASICRGIVELLCESGKRLASTDDGGFVSSTQSLRDSISPVTQEILATSYVALPPQFADEAINWLLADTRRFGLGSGYAEPAWMLAVRLVEKQSPHCSEPLFRALEAAIIHYHCPDEKLIAEYRLSRRKEGHFGDYWGRTQHFLLPALCPTRRSEQTDGLIGVLQRKFAGYSTECFLRAGQIRGGSVSSPIRPERLHRISDRAWLKIIDNKSIPEDRTPQWKQIGPDQITESSIVQFANDLRAVAKRWPNRFAELALRFPTDAHPSYVAAVLDGIKAVKPDEVPEEERASWRPADARTIEAIFEKCHLGDERNVAHSFCWLISARAEEDWSDRTMDRLLGYAMDHADPREGKLNSRRADQTGRDWTLDDLRQNAINCIRGVAGLAIGRLLWEHRNWLQKLKPGLEHLANDSHPAVRVAALEACLPLLNIDKDSAIDLFLQACKADLKVAACHNGVHYFNCCMQSHAGRLSSIIVQMFNSAVDEVAEEGAKEVCARWIFHGFFDEELRMALSGSVPQRKGVAHAAAALMKEDEYRDQCKGLLLALSNDSDKEVRQKASHAVYNEPELLEWQAVKPFLLQFVRSRAFQDDLTGTLFTFEKYSGSLVPFAEVVFAICEGFVGPLADLSRDISTGLSHDASMIPSLLLRLYEQAQRDHSVIATKCLDAWDILFENRIGFTKDITKAIDQ